MTVSSDRASRAGAPHARPSINTLEAVPFPPPASGGRRSVTLAGSIARGIRGPQHPRNSAAFAYVMQPELIQMRCNLCKTVRNFVGFCRVSLDRRNWAALGQDGCFTRRGIALACEREGSGQ